jgi:hypothetical protein
MVAKRLQTGRAVAKKNLFKPGDQGDVVDRLFVQVGGAEGCLSYKLKYLMKVISE